MSEKQVTHTGSSSFWKKTLATFGDSPVILRLRTEKPIRGVWVRLEVTFGEFRTPDGAVRIIEYGDVLGCKEDR